MDIQLIETETKGIARAGENGHLAGEMHYSITSSAFIIIDHTEVEPDYKGKGIGKLLLKKIVEMVREKHIKVLPLCPFANAMFKKTKEFQDVLK